MNVINVAIFEDNRNLRQSLQQLINGSPGFKCTGSFANCNLLVENVQQSNPDVVLMDIQMPGINGIEGVKIIKANFPHVKVLMETIFDEDEKIFDSICNGAEGYILKNTPPVQILDAIKEIYEGGAPMTPSIASKVIKMFKQKQAGTVVEENDLTVRENEVLKCLVEGMSYKMVAASCFISIDTVSGHVKNIYKKLQVHSKSEAVAKAIRGKIV